MIASLSGSTLFGTDGFSIGAVFVYDDNKKSGQLPTSWLAVIVLQKGI